MIGATTDALDDKATAIAIATQPHSHTATQIAHEGTSQAVGGGATDRMFDVTPGGVSSDGSRAFTAGVAEACSTSASSAFASLYRGACA